MSVLSILAVQQNLFKVKEVLPKVLYAAKGEVVRLLKEIVSWV